ncbi:MAE_28990/MAE_18760 family HEPN-like nuclease [Oxalobacteraceae bacterium OTU3CAMAD1]|nr:MAE_28990/MAE_18760 family HEPN-like nuclease [Oxalobacteraceae bacterium OTU3CAMAD1]
MLNAQTEFERRDKEIEEFLLHLEGLEGEIGISASLMNTMKSGVLVMLYNAVESTMTNLMQDVFDHLKTHNVDFTNLNEKMKSIVLGYSKRRSPVKLVKKMTESNLGLAIACFERSDVFSGNIDCKVIRDTMTELGVTSRHRYVDDALLKVKGERNDLAHGNKSFGDCGRAYSAADLRTLHKKIQIILSKVIIDFEAFIAAKAYG